MFSTHRMYKLRHALINHLQKESESKMTMKMFLVLTMSVSALSTAALADGFECQAPTGDLNVKAYNSTHAGEGTRNAAVLILSNPQISSGRKTIARFTDVNGTLANSGASFEADVDLRYNDSARKGELIGGTKLGELDTITLDVAFSYGSPVEAGAELPGKLTLVKRNGDLIELDLVCTRYLKN